jgi:hypothetical protein
MHRAKGKRDRERAALSELACDADRATVKPHQFLDQGEANSASLNRATARTLHAAESLE